MSARDPKRFYRIEARELLDTLSAELLRLSRGEAPPEAVTRLFRAAHTLKGAAAVVGDAEVVELARIIEDVLGDHRDQGTELDEQEISEFLRMVDGIEALLGADLAPKPEPSRGPEADRTLPGTVAAPAAPASDTVEAVRIEPRELDALTENLAGAELQNRALERELRELERDVATLTALSGELLGSLQSGELGAELSHNQRLRFKDSLRDVLDQLAKNQRATLSRADSIAHELRQARAELGRLELVPVSTLFPALERALLVAAHSVKKSVRWQGIGGDTRVDRRLLPRIKDALLHMVRNAVDHGIESESERTRAGKPSTGTVAIRVERRGSRVSFSCEDDGAGVDVPRVRATAIERGLVTSGDELDEQATLALLFRSGFSTRGRVTDLSGRGVGLDVVGATAATLLGEARIRTERGSGSTVELVVPLSLSTALTVELASDDTSVLMPMDAVVAIGRAPRDAIQKSGRGEVLIHEAELLPVLRLGASLGLRTTERGADTQLAYAVVQVDSTRFALLADRAAGIREAVVRALPWAAGTPEGVAGAALDVDGDALLVLDPRGLATILRGQDGRALAPAAAPEARRYLPILVIDDSLTTRMLEQSILETAGFSVEVATCAEEGLELAKKGNYSLFVCDVEMPGMNGFEFCQITRADARLAETSVILVTSLGSDEHRARGAEAGASAYVVKGQFEQDYFLDRVKSLVREDG